MRKAGKLSQAVAQAVKPRHHHSPLQYAATCPNCSCQALVNFLFEKKCLWKNHPSSSSRGSLGLPGGWTHRNSLLQIKGLPVFRDPSPITTCSFLPGIPSRCFYTDRASMCTCPSPTSVHPTRAVALEVDGIIEEILMPCGLLVLSNYIHCLPSFFSTLHRFSCPPIP